MRPPTLLLLAATVAATVAAAPAEVTSTSTETDSRAGASVAEGTFPIGVCAWARPVSSEKFCVVVNDPRDWLP